MSQSHIYKDRPQSSQELDPKKLLVLFIIVNQELETTLYDFIKRRLVASLIEIDGLGSVKNHILDLLGINSKAFAIYITIIKKDAESLVHSELELFYHEHKYAGLAFTTQLDAYTGLNTLYKAQHRHKKEKK